MRFISLAEQLIKRFKFFTVSKLEAIWAHRTEAPLCNVQAAMVAVRIWQNHWVSVCVGVEVAIS